MDLMQQTALLQLAPFIYHGERRRVLAGSRYGGQALGRQAYCLIHQLDGSTQMVRENRVIRPGQTVLLDPGSKLRWFALAHFIRVPFDLVPRRRSYAQGVAAIRQDDDAVQPPLSDLFDGSAFDGFVPDALQTHATELAHKAGSMSPKRARDVWRMNGHLSLFLSQLLQWLDRATSTDHLLELNFANEVERRLMEQARTGMTIAQLAADMRMHRVALTKRYKQERGFGPKQFLTDHRISLAKDLLILGERDISEIAVEVGYRNEAAFRVAFKQRTGTSPREWRHRYYRSK